MSVEEKRKIGTVELLLQRELMDLEDIEGVEVVSLELTKNLKEIKLKITTKEGVFKDRPYIFLLKFKDSYPITPPKIFCETKIFHPNIDNNGNVCLNILKLDWNPIINLRMLTLGLLLLLTDPSPEEPLNNKAAEVMKNNWKEFEKMNKTIYSEYKSNLS